MKRDDVVTKISTAQKQKQNAIELVGCVYNTRNSGDLVITKYVNKSEVHVRFIKTGYTTVVSMGNIRKGNIKDRLLPSVYNVGICGDEIVYINGKHTAEYELWAGVLQRCYSEKDKEKYSAYKDCTVSDNFKYFPYFKEWCNSQIGFGQDGWQLDKDILVKGNKVYSEKTCCFVPREINNLFIKRCANRGIYPLGVSYHTASGKFISNISTDGLQRSLGLFNTPEEAFLVYKQTKEEHIKQVANRWKDRIDTRVYEALMVYKVEITD